MTSDRPPEGSSEAASAAVRRRVPVATAVLVAAAALGTVLARTVWPGLAGLVQRDDQGLRHGQLWRLASPVLVQPGPWVLAAAAVVLVGLLGWLAERWFGRARLVGLCLAGVAAASLVGALGGTGWQPPGIGPAAAGFGLLGGFAVWWLRMRRSGPVSAGAWALLLGVFLALGHDLYGVAVLAGGGVGAVVLRDVPAVYRGRVRG